MNIKILFKMFLVIVCVDLLIAGTLYITGSVASGTFDYSKWIEGASFAFAFIWTICALAIIPLVVIFITEHLKQKQEDL